MSCIRSLGKEESICNDSLHFISDWQQLCLECNLKLSTQFIMLNLVCILQAKMRIPDCSHKACPFPRSAGLYYEGKPCFWKPVKHITKRFQP